MLRLYIDHCVYGRMYCLQRGTIHQRQWESWKAHEHAEEMEMAIFQMGKYYVQTMGSRQTATVVFAVYVAKDGAFYNVVDRDRDKRVL